MHAPLTHSISYDKGQRLSCCPGSDKFTLQVPSGFFFSRSWTAFSSASSFSKSFLRAAIRSESASADCCPASRLPLTRMPAESTQVPPVSATFLVGVCKLDVLLVLLSLTLRGGLLLLLIDRTGCARSCSAGEVLGAGQNWRVQQGRCPTKTAAAVARLELLTDRLALIELDWLACRARVVSVTRWWVAAMTNHRQGRRENRGWNSSGTPSNFLGFQFGF